MASSNVNLNMSQLIQNVGELSPLIEARLGLLLNRQASIAEAFMRSNAKWTDRTGNARSGLKATVKMGNKSGDIIISHSVPYGIWLEVRFSGRYGIIQKTMDQVGPSTMRMASTILGAI